MSVEARLRELAEADLAAWPMMPARLLHVLAPDLGLDIEVAAGMADLATGEPLLPGSRFRIASVTKPFVAAAALRLVETGKISLDDTVATLLAGEYDELLRSGGYDTDAIMLRHLLTHTSGIYDFAADAYDPAITDGFEAQCEADPGRRWTRFEQIGFAISHGHAYGPPGTVWGYSDTGACLVGEILERETGASMGAAIRELIGFERLGLAHTWQETVEPEPPDLPPLSHQYQGEFDIADMDASVDLYGGGGLMSTCRDLSRFFRGAPSRSGVPRALDARVDDHDRRGRAAHGGRRAGRRTHRPTGCSCSGARSAARPGGDTMATGERRPSPAPRET